VENEHSVDVILDLSGNLDLEYWIEEKPEGKMLCLKGNVNFSCFFLNFLQKNKKKTKSNPTFEIRSNTKNPKS
jgi:hypothetical protein